MARAHHQRGGRRIGVWASNYDDVYILRFGSQFRISSFGP
jgi:hypothetical protein